MKKATVLKLAGNLIMGEPVHEFRTRIHELLKGHTEQLAIDLSRVEYIDSSGVAAITAATCAAQKAGATCRFFGASRGIMYILKMMNLDKTIELLPADSAALSTSSRPRPADLGA